MSRNNETIETDEFGVIVWDEALGRYSTIVGQGHAAISISFDVSDVESLKEIVAQAGVLWRKKDVWFRNWMSGCYEFYMKDLKDAWYEGDDPLDFAGFAKRLGQPAGVDFQVEGGSLRYLMSGTNDDLVGDHFIEAIGTGMKPTQFALT